MLDLRSVAVGRVGVTVLPWRRGARLMSTIVAKASFAFPRGAADGPLELTAPRPIRRVELHHRESPARSIREAVDAVPLKLKADVLFAGSAFAVGGPAAEVRARIAVLRGPSTVLDKALRVVGDRAAPDAAPKPFVELPLVYERAAGGIGSAENPLGTELPNVFGLVTSTRPAGFAPVSHTWARRKRLIGGNRKPLEQEVADVEQGIEAYFQSAPDDQQTDKWTGHEKIVLEGLSRSHGVRVLELPGVRALALVERKAGPRLELALECDTIFIDGDAEVISLTWRAALPVDDRATLLGTVFAAGLELAGQPVPWPDLDAAAPPRTIRIDLPPAPRVSQSGTLVMADGGASPGEAPAPAGVSEQPFASTLVIDEPSPGGTALPFHGAAQSSDRHDQPARSVPGAPWARSKQAPIPEPSSALTLEISLDGVEAPPSVPGTGAESPSTPATPPSVEPAAPPPARVVATAWRKPEPEPAAPPTAAAPTNAAAARAQAPEVKRSLYGKFGGGGKKGDR